MKKEDKESLENFLSIVFWLTVIAALAVLAWYILPWLWYGFVEWLRVRRA